jgi:hypothetical protein
MTLAGAELPPRSIKKRTVGASRQAAKAIHDGVATGTDGSERLVQCGGWDHYADAVYSEPGRCWRMVPGYGPPASKPGTSPEHSRPPAVYRDT